MRSLYLGLAIHNHQPVGNFDWVCRQAYRQAYLPMIEALERHPRVRLALHYSGCLLDWIEANQPEFLSRLAALAARGQVEIMTGGYYEPILPAIPDDDKLGQIEKLSDYIRRRLNYEPTGLWLAERVWEPHLPKLLEQAGVSWTVLDDYHFKRAGLGDEDLYGYYITEEEGATVNLFGTSKQLRYSIPWRSVGEVLQYLQSQASEEPRIAVMGDDGEKFGIWPYTYDKCWQQGWVNELFSAFENNADWLHTVPPGEFVRRYPAAGRIYLPTSSYAEMSEWSLPAQRAYEYGQLSRRLEAEGQDGIASFLAGGFWRYFMVKYPEVNQMHKKMLRVHRKVKAARARKAAESGQQELWAGQCNCAYWHGVFGGTYLNHVRNAIYEHLITGETLADRALHGDRNYLLIDESDYNCDGSPELTVDTQLQSVSLSPAQGGSILEWDLRHPAYNLTNVLTRRGEGYHQQLLSAERAPAEMATAAASSTATNIHEVVRAKEEGLNERLHYDRYTKLSLLDHLLAMETTAEDFARARVRELGDFIDASYTYTIRRRREAAEIVLERTGQVVSDGFYRRLSVEKQLWIPGDRAGFGVQYRVFNPSDKVVNGRFGSEWNLNLSGGTDGRGVFLLADGRPVEGWTLQSTLDFGAEDLVVGNRDLGWQVLIHLSPGGRVWCSPLETISNSEGGFERTYQGTTFLFHWPLDLAPEGLFHKRLNLTAEPLPA